MTPPLLISLFVALIGLLLILTGAMYWLSAGWFKVPNVSFRRAIVTSACVALLNIAFSVFATWLLSKIASSETDVRRFAPILISTILLVAGIAFDLWVIKRMLRGRWGQTALVFLAAFAVDVSAALGSAYAVRTWMVQSYVTPNGGMAPTILGLHGRVTCPNCGFSYDVGRPDSNRPPESLPTQCPNCGLPGELPASAEALSGDRFVVDKRATPKRWDIVVYDAPKQPGVMYVKRLVGLPGETIELQCGHVFIDGKMMRRDLSTATDLWRLTNDTQFKAKQLAPQTSHWKAPADSKWHEYGNAWACNASDGAGGSLQFEGEITEDLAYNADRPGMPHPQSPLYTGDVKLDCQVQSFGGDGKLVVTWDFNNKKVVAIVSADGRGSVESSQKAEGALPKNQLAGQLITLAVRDGRAYLCENGDVVVSQDIGSDAIDDQGRTPVSGCRLSIAAERCELTLSRIVTYQQLGFRTAEEMIGQPSRVRLPMRLAGDEVYLLGDNTLASLDSRFDGPVKTSAILAVARWIYWPVSRWHEFQ